jgi:hypothetical protein
VCCLLMLDLPVGVPISCFLAAAAAASISAILFLKLLRVLLVVCLPMYGQGDGTKASHYEAVC